MTITTPDIAALRVALTADPTDTLARSALADACEEAGMDDIALAQRWLAQCLPRHRPSDLDLATLRQRLRDENPALDPDGKLIASVRSEWDADLLVWVTGWTEPGGERFPPSHHLFVWCDAPHLIRSDGRKWHDCPQLWITLMRRRAGLARW